MPVLIAAAPLGLLASGAAWGEWSRQGLRQRLGYVPRGVARASDWWKGLLPHYGQTGGVQGLHSVAAYLVAALLGVAALGVAVWLLVTAGRRFSAFAVPAVKGALAGILVRGILHLLIF